MSQGMPGARSKTATALQHPLHQLTRLIAQCNKALGYFKEAPHRSTVPQIASAANDVSKVDKQKGEERLPQYTDLHERSQQSKCITARQERKKEFEK
eukprot:1156277-Pelagomonas_calceolata.AAC.8